MQIDLTQASYDRLADEYTRRMLAELDSKPLDRELLDSFARRVAGKGRACDLGCGPGQVARYLRGRGADVFGIDLSPAMIERAKREHPGIEFQVGDMRALTLPDEQLGGIAAFYSLIHIPRADVTAVLRELRRVLQPEGILLISFHRGDEVRHFDQLWELPVSLDYVFFQRNEMVGYLQDAGFVIQEIVERESYPDEIESNRVYILAQKPSR